MERTNNLGFQTGSTQTELYKHRRCLEAGNFGFRNYKNCTILVAKTKAVTTKLVCIFVLAYALPWFSHDVAKR